MMRRALIVTLSVTIVAWLVPLRAAAQPGAGTPRSQGPMVLEPIHSGFMAAPDVKVTEVDRKTSALVGGYAGWITDDTFFIGGGGYWLANDHRHDRDMAYGGLVVQWLAHGSGPIGFGVKGLFGGGEATMSQTFTVSVPAMRAPNGQITIPPTTRTEISRFRQGFVIAEPEALVLVRMSRHLRLTGGVGYRFTGTRRRAEFGDFRLNGATGSVSLQIGGGS